MTSLPRTSTVAPPSASHRQRWRADWTTWLPWASAVFVLVIWQIGTTVGFFDRQFFSAPSSVVVAGYHAIQTHDFWYDVYVSFGKEFLVGYVAAVAAAVPFGLLTGWFRRCQYFFDPMLNALNATPRIALLPVIVVWFGLGIESKVVIVFVGVFISVALNTFDGVRTVDRNQLDVARSFGASTLRRLTSVVLPSVIPFALVGMRLGVGRGVEGVMVGEFYTSTAGLGYFVLRAGRALEVDQLIFGAVVITIIALLMFQGVSRLERRFTAWRPRVGSAK